MYRGKKIITATPSGRRRYLNIQLRYIFRLKHLIDKHIFWVNTNVPEDLEYIENLAKQYPDFFELKYLDEHPPKEILNSNVYHFYQGCNEPETVYVKIDDDILYMEVNKFQDFLDFRIDNPQYFLVYANTINNGICYLLHQNMGALDQTLNSMPNKLIPSNYNASANSMFYHDYALVSFKEFSKKIYNNDLSDFKFKKWVMNHYERCSINFISWLGEEFAKFENVGNDDEKWLSVDHPAEIGVPNCIYGQFIVLHYAYGPQRKELDDRPEILSYFDQLSTMEI